MRIIIDAMGGDNAPDEIVLGAVQAAKEFQTEIVGIFFANSWELLRIAFVAS